MLTVTDEFKGPGLVFTMLRKCFGEDFDAKGKCSQIAFTRDNKVCMKYHRLDMSLDAVLSLCRVPYSIFRVNLTNNCEVIGKIVREFK